MKPGDTKKLAVLYTIIFGFCAVTFCGLAEVAFRLTHKSWYFQARRISGRSMVELNPYTGASLIPNVVQERGARISHNSFGTRGPEFAMPKPKGLFRIAAMGGSSTYCVSVSNDQTWEAYLGNDLGTNREVLNFGIPGATSVESTIQSALLFSDVQPDIALYYLGWNDARVQHVKHLRPDWADYHGKSMMAIGLSGNEMNEPCAAAYLIKRAVFRYFFPKMDADALSRTVQGDEDQLTDRIDARALSLYVRNLENITALCRVQHVRPIFIPQVMNFEALKSEQRYGWLPFVRDKDLKKVITAYNDATRNFAERENAGFIKEVLESEFGADDFIDQGHFTAKGNVKFAKAVAAGLRRMAVCNDVGGTDSVSQRNELGIARDR